MPSKTKKQPPTTESPKDDELINNIYQSEYLNTIKNILNFEKKQIKILINISPIQKQNSTLKNTSINK